jgi:putative ABC transport system permease protein
MIRTSGDPIALVPAIQQELKTLDPTASQFRAAENLEKAVRDYVSPQRFTTSIIGFFALLGLLLAALGVYGVMRFWVAARIPEIGVRMALGASRADVLTLVLQKAAGALMPGLALGITGAIALQKIIASELYGVSPTDTTVFVAVSLVMALVALAAALLPARWAARTDPVVALRHE